MLRGLVALAVVWLLYEFSTLHKASLSFIPTALETEDRPDPIVLVEPVVITKSKTITRVKTKPEPFYFPPMPEPEKPIVKEPIIQEPSGPKMIGVILLNTELDQLDIRLHELFSVVDVFVIIESQSTMNNGSKSLRARHYIELPPMPTDMEAEDYVKAWGVEAYTRGKGLDMTIRDLQPRKGDWILLSDLDEILRPSILQAMKTPRPSLQDLFRLACRFYHYLYEIYNDFWNGPVLLRYRERESHSQRMAHGFGGPEYSEQQCVLSMIGDNEWHDVGYYMREHRNSRAATLVKDACWHCSWCFDRMEFYVDKMKSYSHTEHNDLKFQTQEWIIDYVNRGIDLFERSFMFMLDRYGKRDARFIDVDESLLPPFPSPPSKEKEREESQDDTNSKAIEETSTPTPDQEPDQ
ncbi:hypothetical protein CPB97_007894 [Podila verticillata]|nr:hypothetical protein CPB97_007894 [Podila verticillata]